MVDLWSQLSVEQVFRIDKRSLLGHVMRWAGELLLLGLDTGAAESAFQRALAIARLQGARALELRAATSPARSWQREGHKNLAHDLLAPVYAGFAEGLDTPDLSDAKALLDSL